MPLVLEAELCLLSLVLSVSFHFDICLLYMWTTTAVENARPADLEVAVPCSPDRTHVVGNQAPCCEVRAGGLNFSLMPNKLYS